MESKSIRNRQGGYNIKYPVEPICKECDREFTTLRGLHRHISVHKKNVAQYYLDHFPRVNKLTGKLLPFKDSSVYFSRDFETRMQFDKWCRTTDLSNKDLEYILEKVKERMESKGLQYAPFSLECKHSFLPNLETLKSSFGTYKNFCDKLGYPALFDKGLIKDFWDDLPKDLSLFVDTREKTPFKFKNHEKIKMALDIGDYTLVGKYYNNTFVERKSGEDLVSTLNDFNNNKQRFENELIRAYKSRCYLFIVVESNFAKICRNATFVDRKVNVEYVTHNIKELTHKYPRTCQFVFANDRATAEDLTLRLLYHGSKVHRTDIQYFLDSYVDQR